MTEGTNNNGTNPVGLTVDTAATALEGLLSASEEKEPVVARSQKEPEHREPTAQEDVEIEDEPVQDQDSESGDPSDEDGEQEEHDDRASQLRKYRVKVDGEEIEVPEDELVKGYSRTQDYTRKTQALAEQRKQFESTEQAVRAEREKLAVQLTQIADALQSMTPAEPDWDTLRIEDPQGFPAAYAAWQLHQNRLASVRAAQSEAIQKVVDDRQTELRAVAQAEKAKLIEAIPEWSKPDVAKKESSELREYAIAQGYKSEDLDQIFDHRVFLTLRKAMLFDRAQAKKPALETKIDAVRSATPGTSDRNRPKTTEATRARQRLAKTGRVEDAASAIELMFDN